MTQSDVRAWIGGAFSPRSIVQNAAGAFLAMLFFLFVARFGQPIESQVAPVVAIAPYAKADIYRDGAKACFTMHLTKLHAATVMKYEFFAETRLSAFIPLSAYLADPVTRTRLADSDLVSHPVGSQWNRTYCFDLPKTINEGQCFRLTGHAEHDRHPFWTTISPVRPLVFQPISGHGDCELKS